MWCRKWRMKVNPLKSNVAHFRPKHVPSSSANFRYGDYGITTVSSYKYLGVILDEFLDYTKTATMSAESVGRALGSTYNRYERNRGFGYSTYTKLYGSGVVPILDYCSFVWGYNDLDKIDTIENRAIRLYIGVHRFAANKAINAYMGWISCRTRRHVNMLRLWNKLITVDNSRLVNNIFNWDRQMKRGRS